MKIDLNYKISKKLTVLFLLFIAFLGLIPPVSGLKTKKSTSIESRSHISLKVINNIKKNFAKGLRSNKSGNIKDFLPAVDEKEIEVVPTLTEKIPFQKHDKNLWITLSCQLIALLSLLYVLHLILYNRKIPISYEPHVQCKYHLNKKRFNFHKF